MVRALPIFLIISFNTYSQDVAVIKFKQLDALLKSDEHKIQVINFWATWCAPCVKELPLFEDISDNEVNVVLINLDFADKIERVRNFVARKNIKKRVLLLDEIDYNSWIDRVDTSWSGAIPATLFINTRNGKRKFVSSELSAADLEKILVEFKN